MEERIEFRHYKFFDVKGVFSFGADGVAVSFLWKKEFIAYSKIAAVTRRYYDRQKSLGTQANPNEYRIELRGGRALAFRVAHGEEDAYQSAIDSLARKIYGMNRLGFGLTSKVKRDAVERRQKDVQFAKEKPIRDFSLERAIEALLQKCGLALDDQTDYDPRSPKKKPQPVFSADESLYIEFAQLVSNHDKDVVSQVSDKIGHPADAGRDMGNSLPHRGVNENTPKEDIRWFAMIDTLEAHGYAKAIDAKSGADEIAGCLEQIKSKLGVQLDTSMDLSYLDGNETVETLETPRILNLIGMNTVGRGYSLTGIDIESDSYVLCLLPNKVFNQCEKRLRGTKFSISSF